MKRFKTLVSIILMSCMLLGMTLTAIAADSPETDGIVRRVRAAIDAAGRNVDVRTRAVPEEYKAVAAALDMNTVRELLGDDYVEGMKILDIRDVYVAGDEGLVEWPVTVTFEVPGILATTNVGVLCYNKVKGVWERITAVAGAGTITATFDSLSLVAFIVDPATAEGVSDDDTSPKTGEASVAVAGVVAMLAVVVACGLGRKKEFGK